MAAIPEGTLSFELKAAAFTFPVIRLLAGDLEAVAAELGAKVDQAPDFFRHTPVVVDLGNYPPSAGDLEFPLLVGLLRGYGMIPFGVRGGTPEQNRAAEAMELAILGDSFARPPKSAPPSTPRPTPAAAKPGATSQGLPAAQSGAEARNGPAPAPAAVPADPAPSAPAPDTRAAPHGTPGEPPRRNGPAPSPGAPAGFLLVTRPVRSGQRIYAAGGDLSVVAPVSSGAELMADGNIHVYGPLRGRALAGLSGNTEARIFCQELQAELVSVAGHYRVSESIPAELRGVPVQIYLDQKVLRIERL